jgi:hypothetical protein
LRFHIVFTTAFHSGSDKCTSGLAGIELMS